MWQILLKITLVSYGIIAIENGALPTFFAIPVLSLIPQPIFEFVVSYPMLFSIFELAFVYSIGVLQYAYVSTILP